MQKYNFFMKWQKLFAHEEKTISRMFQRRFSLKEAVAYSQAILIEPQLGQRPLASASK